MPTKKGSKRKLYALLVGVNRYKHTRALQGCEEDVNEVHEFLKSQKEFDLDAVILSTATRDKKLMPTKANIVHHFEEHFSQTKDGDVAFFFFAGHGVREETSIPAFKQDEADELIKTLACYDSSFKKGVGMEGSTLASKEIRYLLHKVFGGKDVHTVLVIDSCHSEGSTRKIELETEADKACGSRLIGPHPIRERDYDGFCFSEEITKKDFENKTINELIPLTNQVQLGACRAIEEAWEARRPNGRVGGYFTMTIMDLLRRSGGNITYYELKNRATSIMRDMKSRPQVPQIFAGIFNPNDIYKTFLNGTPNKKPAYCNVSFNQKKGWTIDLGAIHGIPVNTKKSPTPVEVFAIDKPKTIFKAKASEVFPGYCVIEFDKKSPSNDGKSIYSARVEGAAMQPINVFIDGKEKKEATKYFEKQNKDNLNTYVKLVAKENEADYVLRAAEEEYTITYPSDDKPLVLQIERAEAEEKAEQAFKYFTRISQWEFVRQIHNPDTQLHKKKSTKQKMYPVELKLYQEMEDGKEVQIPLDDPQIDLKLDRRTKSGKAYTKVRFELINHSDQPLYCAMIYMSMLFGANPGLLKGKVELLEKGIPVRSVGVRGTDYAPLGHKAYIDDFGWDYMKDYLKILVSTSEFEATALTLMPDLPEPIHPDKDGNRSLLFDEFEEPEDTPPKDDWTTYTFEIFGRKSKKN